MQFAESVVEDRFRPFAAAWVEPMRTLANWARRQLARYFMPHPRGHDFAMVRNVLQETLAQRGFGGAAADRIGLGHQCAVGAGQPVGGARVADTGQRLKAGEFDPSRNRGAVQRAAGGDVVKHRFERRHRDLCGNGAAFSQGDARQARAR